MELIVAKVGGSLFDLPDLRDRLCQLAALRDRPVLFVPGGGVGADVIRHLDRVHGLGEEAAHWLALRVLSVNAHFLGHLLGAPVVQIAAPRSTSPRLSEMSRGRGPAEPEAPREGDDGPAAAHLAGGTASPSRGASGSAGPARPTAQAFQPGPARWLAPVSVLDPLTFCQADDDRIGALPHRWQVTSDAIAARAAEVAGADLVLLKSVDLPARSSWSDAARTGLVDQTLEMVVNRSSVAVTWVNLRRPSDPLK